MKTVWAGWTGWTGGGSCGRDLLCRTREGGEGGRENVTGVKGASTGRNGDADDRAMCDRRTGGMGQDARAHTQPHSTQLSLSARFRLKASSLGFLVCTL